MRSRSRRIIMTSRITSVAPLVRGKPDDNGKATYKVVMFRIPKKEVAAPTPSKKKILEKLEKIVFGRRPDKNIHVFPEREGMRRSLTLLEKDLLSERRGPWRRAGMKKRHQVRRRRKTNLGRFSATLQVV